MRKCIIDKNARIGSNCKIINTANVQEANKEEDGYVIKDGIVVVIKSSVFPGDCSCLSLLHRHMAPHTMCMMVVRMHVQPCTGFGTAVGPKVSVVVQMAPSSECVPVQLPLAQLAVMPGKLRDSSGDSLSHEQQRAGATWQMDGPREVP